MNDTELNSSFNFALPERHDGVSEIAHAALQLAELAGKLALEDRTLVTHKTGRSENVAEHSNMLAIVAPAIAEQFYPHLDANLVARYAPIHDAIEAYVGDTPTHDISEADMVAKQSLESRGMHQFKDDFNWLPGFSRVIDDYEAQIIPEARFVRMIDKWMPLLVHFVEGGVTLRGYISPEQLRLNSRERSAQFRAEYPEYSDLIAVREELAELAIKVLLQD